MTATLIYTLTLALILTVKKALRYVEIHTTEQI